MSVYLDHAATTPMADAAIAAMTSSLSKIGNPSSLHTQGRAQGRWRVAFRNYLYRFWHRSR